MLKGERAEGSKVTREIINSKIYLVEFLKLILVTKVSMLERFGRINI